MTLWSAWEAADATGGEIRGDWSVSGISIDTRSIEPGELFVALKDVRDGHDFVAQALEEGAGAALVSRVPDGVAADAPLLLVPDVLGALEDLGRAARARFRGQLIAVTGSVGKTSTKEMLRSILARQGKVHAAEKSFNNHWGVPVTLARMPWDADFAVVEIGMNHPGEIAPLARLAAPHVGLITTIAPAHLEGFANGIEGIAREKASLFEGLVPGGTAVLPEGLETSGVLRVSAAKLASKIVTFGENTGDYRLVSAELNGDLTVAKYALPQGEALVKIMSAGRHFAVNGLGALAAAEAAGADIALAARDMTLWQPPEGRGRREVVVLDAARRDHSFELIDDSYNANPASVAAALEVLAASTPVDGVGRIRKGRRIAVLGDMLETGSGEAQLHRDLASLQSLGAVDVVHTVGPLMKNLWETLPDELRGTAAPDAATLAATAHDLIDAGDVLMVKGSLGSKVGTVVKALQKLAAPG